LSHQHHSWNDAHFIYILVLLKAKKVLNLLFISIVWEI